MTFERKSRFTPKAKADSVTEPRPSVVDPPPKPKEKEKAKSTAAARARAARAKRASSPPTRVTPGWIHKAAATKILEFLQVRITKETGNPFYVGDLPTSTDLATEGNIIDERPPVELLSRILAHLAHRVPGVKNIEKKLEGKDSTSGILSDITAFFAQLYTLNENTFKAVQHQMMEQAKAKRNSTENGGVSHNVPV